MEVVVTTGAIRRANLQSSSQIVNTNKPTLSFFLQAGCPSCHPTITVRSTRANAKQILGKTNMVHSFFSG